MATLLNSALNAANTFYLSGSIWFRIPTANVTVNIFDSSIYTSGFASGACYLAIGTEPRKVLDLIIYHQENSKFQSTWVRHSPQTTHTVEPAQWHHLAFAIDLNHAAYEDPAFGGGYTLMIDPYISNFVLDGSSFTIGYFQTDSDLSDFHDIEFTTDRSFTEITPRANLQLSGSAVAVPALGNIADPSAFWNYNTTSSIVEFGDYQIWAGTYIDWTNASNFSKVVSISGGTGRPVNPTTAATAFGTQTILFKGQASDNSFFTNRGNGGAFVKTGTVTDFTPTPSYT